MASSVHNKRQKLSHEASSDQQCSSTIIKNEDSSLILETVLDCELSMANNRSKSSRSDAKNFGLSTDQLDDDTSDGDDDDEEDDDDDEDEDDDDDDDEDDEDDDEDLDDDDDDEDEDEDDDDDEEYTTKSKLNGNGRKNNNNRLSGNKGKSLNRKTHIGKQSANKTTPCSNNNTANFTSKSQTSSDQGSSLPGRGAQFSGGQYEIQKQLAAAGPAGVAAAAAIASAKKRKRPHIFETNPSVRKRQQTRLIRKLKACIDEYTMRVGQQAIVLITMPGKQVHNYKVFGAQPLENVIRDCKDHIMSHLERALLEQAPEEIKEDPNKHELPPLVIDGIPTPVEKMTQAQLRAFIPMMLKYSTGRGKPGWGKDATRPAWWPESLPWANVRSDARDEDEKQRVSWTTTLRQIVTNCYKYHGREDLLPSFDENEDQTGERFQEQSASTTATNTNTTTTSSKINNTSSMQHSTNRHYSSRINRSYHNNKSSGNTTASSSSMMDHSDLLNSTLFHQSDQLALTSLEDPSKSSEQGSTSVYAPAASFSSASNVMHTINNGDGTVSLIQVDPANTQILTLPDGTQVRAVRLQTLSSSDPLASQLTGETATIHQVPNDGQAVDPNDLVQGQTLTITEASLNSDGQIIVTGEDGVQSCYSMSNLVSIPASMYQQFATSGGSQTISLMGGDAGNQHTISIQALQDTVGQDQQIQLSGNQQFQNIVQLQPQQEEEHATTANDNNNTHDQTDKDTSLITTTSTNVASKSDGDSKLSIDTNQILVTNLVDNPQSQIDTGLAGTANIGAEGSNNNIPIATIKTE